MPPGLSPEIICRAFSAGLKTRSPGLKVRGWHLFPEGVFRKDVELEVGMMLAERGGFEPPVEVLAPTTV